MVDIPTADIRRERIALPLLRDERLELQVRELSRIVAERSGQAIDSNAEPGRGAGLRPAAGRGAVDPDRLRDPRQAGAPPEAAGRGRQGGDATRSAPGTAAR